MDASLHLCRIYNKCLQTNKTKMFNTVAKCAKNKNQKFTESKLKWPVNLRLYPIFLAINSEIPFSSIRLSKWKFSKTSNVDKKNVSPNTTQATRCNFQVIGNTREKVTGKIITFVTLPF